MADTYAIILDWDLAHQIMVPIIASADDPAPLRIIKQYDPAVIPGSVDRRAVGITQQEAHAVTNAFSGVALDAHICRVTGV